MAYAVPWPDRVGRAGLRAGPWSALWRPTLSHVWLATALMIAGAGSSMMPIEAIDYWWTVKVGELIWQAGALPVGDELIYTPIREPVIHGQWLAQLLVYAIHAIGGPELALALRTAVALGIAALLLGTGLREGAGVRATAISVILGSVLVATGLAIRPQLLAIVPFLVVARAAASPPGTIVGALGVAGVVAFWANVHGSFVLAYALLGAAVLDLAWSHWRGGRTGRAAPLLRLIAVCAVAPLANPYGLGLVRYVVDVVVFNGLGTTVGVLAAEWEPPTLRSGYGAAFYASVLMLMVLLARGHRPRLGEGLLLLGFGLMTVQSIRNELWWGLALTPFVARSLTAWSTRLASGIAVGVPALNAVCLALFALVVVAGLPWLRSYVELPTTQAPILDETTPVAVAEYLAQHPTEGQLFNASNWGAYFGWRLGPERRVFIDNRFELHPAEVWTDYIAIGRGHVSWEERVAKYGATQLALDVRAQEPLIEAVRRSPDWTLAYQDHQAVVFDRRPGGE